MTKGQYCQQKENNCCFTRFVGKHATVHCYLQQYIEVSLMLPVPSSDKVLFFVHMLGLFNEHYYNIYIYIY